MGEKIHYKKSPFATSSFKIKPAGFCTVLFFLVTTLLVADKDTVASTVRLSKRSAAAAGKAPAEG